MNRCSVSEKWISSMRRLGSGMYHSNRLKNAGRSCPRIGIHVGRRWYCAAGGVLHGSGVPERHVAYHLWNSTRRCETRCGIRSCPLGSFRRRVVSLDNTELDVDVPASDRQCAPLAFLLAVVTILYRGASGLYMFELRFSNFSSANDRPIRIRTKYIAHVEVLVVPHVHLESELAYG